LDRRQPQRDEPDGLLDNNFSTTMRWQENRSRKETAT